MKNGNGQLHHWTPHFMEKKVEFARVNTETGSVTVYFTDKTFLDILSETKLVVEPNLHNDFTT